MKQLEPYEQRMIDEYNELGDIICDAYLNGLSDKEQS